MPPAVAAAPAAEGGVKKKKRSKEDKGYAGYLHKVMKSLYPKEKGITISGKGMEILNAMIEDLEARISDQSFKLAKFSKKSTLAAPHVQTATKMVFPPEMGGMAIQEGTKCLTKYLAA